MWKDPDPDPGGNPQEGASSGSSLRELSDLKDQNEQQQLLIAQLKEMLRKDQSNVTQEKVEEYMNTLSKAKAKKSRTRKDESASTERSISSGSSSSIDIAKKQKLNLLKQQLEENKARLAERGKNQRGIEEMVIQLKAQLNDSQQLIPSNLTMIGPKNLEYDKNTSQDELYNILLTKERRITDLLNKVQKQEATILDLEENLKEKDSVIDARTKAITLMTDSLSKKGKSTLDALDDTKEQMRKMQENFVQLEGEMKARQMKLLSDLKDKNLEIAELQEMNQTLLKEKTDEAEDVDYRVSISDLQKRLDGTLAENEAHLLKISELEKQLQDSINEFTRLKNTGQAVQAEQSNDEEVKLKKQLEELNKNMIKVKAQSKSKIKELNKKLDQIKKASDANALIVQLQNENTKLSEKVAVLEEEKGNMQLKMVESSDSTKDASIFDKELEEKLEKSLEDLEEKDKIISLLETEILGLKEEIKVMSEKVSSLSHLENVQVSTEMKSIQVEEQLDTVESENLKLKEEIEDLVRQKEELLAHIEELKKEKQEINTKLENYIQENMELIDKLEKLSAEKVSSAESIEIVEGLTQQEKLELAAYQKNLDVHIEGETIKCSEDEHLEPPTELNESVLQLSEDSTELLQKIDMFNIERKEVMTKMESLRDENNLLNMKLKEIENNRDILAETYEQLQTEKEELQNENEALVKKMQELQSHAKEVLETDHETESVARAKLQELQSEYEKLLAENDALKRTFKEYDTRIHEKHDLETELSEANERIRDLEAKLQANLEEITNYQSVIEENKNELINSASVINDLQAKLDAKQKDIVDLNVILNDLNGLVTNLQIENSKLGNFEFMESQVTELKTALDDQIQQAQEYEEEISRNNDIINELNSKLIEMNKKIIETEHEMEMKDIAYKKLVGDLQAKETTVENLRQQIQEKDKTVGSVIQDMKDKYLSLQKQLDGNSGSLEAKILELTNKNKEQMDKMKKIAANLKKKQQAYQELEEKYNEEKEKWETEVNEKESIISNSKDKIASMLSQLRELEEEINLKNEKLAESESKIKQLTHAIQNLEQNKAELQTSIAELKHKEQKLTEVSLKQELSTSLHESFGDIPSNQDLAKEEKIKELELILETNQADIAHYSERIHQLEEHISWLEQEKETLVQKTAELSDQLNATSRSVEEKACVEEELGQKLLQVTANDEVLVKQLEEVTEQNKELAQKNKEVEEINLKLKVKLKKAHERVAQLKTLQTNFEELENTNSELRKQLAHLEANQKHIQDQNQELQKQNQSDYEKIEADYQAQLEELVKCRNDLTVECEKLRETLKEMAQREEDLVAEISEYKVKLEEVEANNKERLEELADEARVASFNWKDSLKEIQSLNKQIDFLEKELIFAIAKDTVQTIVLEAENRIRSISSTSSQTDKVTSATKESATDPKNASSTEVQTENEVAHPEIVPTFHWPDSQQQALSSQNWFTSQSESKFPAGAVSQSQAPASSQRIVNADTSKEELLNKVKALEFLLYNMDKEKEEAFYDCMGMVNELISLIYEKVNSSGSNMDKPLSDIESQVMSEKDITDTASDKKQLQSIEFETTNASLGEQLHPVVEDVIQPKRAYLTYQPDGAVKPEAFGENDDGWGWGPEEAKLEEEHQSKTESVPLRNEIARLNEALQVLQMERENHLEEIKQLQVKSGKLIKKCKELKQKNDQLLERQQNKTAEGADFFDLDAAIQEELKTQIAHLEKKVKELTNELEKEKHEKVNILKRVDVLTAANERMVEMKEIQDAEVLLWKRKHEQVEEKLQQYEWGSDGFSTKPKPVQEESASEDNKRRIEELEQTIKELSLDNEELQALLEEQRQIRLDLEKVKTSPEMEEQHKKLLDLENQVKQLEQEVEGKAEEIRQVLVQRDDVLGHNKELQRLIQVKEEVIKEFEENLKLVTEKSEDCEKRLMQNEKLVKDMQESEKNHTTDQVKELEMELFQLNQLKAQQEQLLLEKETAFNELVASLEQVNLLKDELEIQIKQIRKDLEEQREKYDKLQIQSSRTISELEQQLTFEKEQFGKSKTELEEKVGNLLNELQRLKQTRDQLLVDVTTVSQELEQQQQKYNQLYTETKQQEASKADAFDWAQEKHKLETLLSEKEGAVIALTLEKEELEKQVLELRLDLEQRQGAYDQLVRETDEKISNTVKELEENWIVQVDQRGADVAESWKLHLESVEAEFASIQEKLRYEINELEEKCNALVNENNELRKNVDADIRNEVDRISALQQQITDGQRYITELNNNLLEKQQENDTLISKLTMVEQEKEELSSSLREKENKLASLSIVVDTTQKQFDEKREVVEEIVRILETNTTFPISFEKEDILSEFRRQLQLLNEKQQEVQVLNQSVQSLQNQLGSIQDNEGETRRLDGLVQELQKQLEEKDNEIYGLKKLVEDSQKQFLVLHEKDEEILNLNKLVEDLQRQLASGNEAEGEVHRLSDLVRDLQGQVSYLQEKDEEIVRLNQLIENYKVQQDINKQELEKYSQEQVTANMALEDYQRKLDEFSSTYFSLQNSLEEKNQLIATLNQQLQLTEGLKNDNNRDVEQLQEEISQVKKDCTMMQQSLAECQEQLFNVTNELTNKTNQLDSVNQQLEYSQQNYEIQETELNRLRELLQSKDQEYLSSTENLRKTHLMDLENRYEELLAAKDLDIESFKTQLNESVQYSNQLVEKISFEETMRQQLQNRVKELEDKMHEQTTLLDEEDKQLTEMRHIIEQQVMKIEELKNELFVKSRDYDSIIAEMDIGRKPIMEQPAPSVSVKVEQASASAKSRQLEEDLSEPVSRAELDIALYMLHQRDVRCEELTVELTQLLEERDTLQLRLSNAIREKEEIRRKITGADDLPVPSTSTSPPATPPSKASAVSLSATELATEADTSRDTQNLESKLSQLKSVGYKKDKTFVDEQEFRRYQQMSIMQQHISEASRLPAEAAAKLVDASYTLSRDVQSPSKVLLNWLWGRSTPKVNDT